MLWLTRAGTFYYADANSTFKGPRYIPYSMVFVLKDVVKNCVPYRTVLPVGNRRLVVLNRSTPKSKLEAAAVLRIRIRIGIRILRIHMFLGLLDPDPDPLVRGVDPDP
jgi:hypothetical protein